MSESSTIFGADDESKAMLELATPDLYRANVFRVLGLHVDVSSGELAKRQKKMKMLEKLGADYRVRSAIFPLDPPPSEDDIRKAGQQLRDPESRLVHEVLWFWPAEYGKNSDGDSEVDLLRHNDVTTPIGNGLFSWSRTRGIGRSLFTIWRFSIMPSRSTRSVFRAGGAS